MFRFNRIIFLTTFLATILFLVSAYSPVIDPKQRAPLIQSDHWINSNGLDWNKLKDKVVMVEFWTFECYNCKNVEPYVKQWYQKFHDKGFEIVAVHSPEFDRERKIENVQQYVKDNGIKYPVAIDNDFGNWKRFSNRYWPAMYLVDKNGFIRYRFIGEGRYGEIERTIQALLDEKM